MLRCPPVTFEPSFGTNATDRCLVQQFKVGLAVITFEEARLAIVATLCDMLWHPRNIIASRSWQGQQSKGQKLDPTPH